MASKWSNKLIETRYATPVLDTITILVVTAALFLRNTSHNYQEYDVLGICACCGLLVTMQDLDAPSARRSLIQ